MPTFKRKVMMSQEITVVVIGMTSMNGTSNKGQGSPYSFCQLTYLKPVTPHFKNDYMERKEAGFSPATINFSEDPALWLEFQKIPFGQKISLVLEPDPQDIQKSIAVGFKRLDQKQA